MELNTRIRRRRSAFQAWEKLRIRFAKLHALPRTRALILALGMGALSVLPLACTQQPRSPVSRLDTPQHHSLRGQDALEDKDWTRAAKFFEQALQLHPKYAPALAGKAVVLAQRSAEDGLGQDQREDRFEEALSLLEDAEDEARTEEERRVVHNEAIRVYRLGRQTEADWVEEAEAHYEEALELDPQRLDARPHLYMARAYRDAYLLPQAEERYRLVLGMQHRLGAAANAELEIVQKVRRAAPGSLHGKSIAFDVQISRADLAALLVEELRLEALYKRGTQAPPAFQASRTPEARAASPSGTVPANEITDIDEHPLAEDIREVTRIGVIGLEVDGERKFYPHDTVRRAEFALIIEDVLVKVTGETGLKTRFIGQTSPFVDVRADVPYFNAVQTVVSRALLVPKNKIQGLFAPLDPLSGADALLVMRMLKDELRSYLRG